MVGSRKLLVAGALALALAGCGGSREVTVHALGRTVRLPHGSTFGDAVSRLGLHAPRGNLLAVDGSVLRRGAVPGRLLLDGVARPRSTVLRDGDRIAAIPGRSRTERTVRTVVRVAKGMAADPEFYLSRTPGKQIVVRGAISRDVVSSSFVPTGKSKEKRAVALTFDDGPSPTYTPKLLATLRRLHVKATFFDIGYLADEYPQLVRRELRAGMEVGNHTYNHPEVPPFDRLPAALLRDEISLGARSLVRAGAKPTLLRPPGGGTSQEVVDAAKRIGERVVLWSVDPVDWEPGSTAAEIAQRVLAKVRPGSIVDLHDGGGDRSATIAALPRIVKGIRARGLKLVVV